MNRNPTAGDIIRIEGKKGELLVTESATVFGASLAPGEPMHIWFTAVGMKTTDAITGAIDGSKEKKYYTEQVGANPATPLSDITLIATAKFKKEVKTTYFVKKIKE